MRVQLTYLSLRSVMMPILVVSLGLASAAYGEKGGNGNGNGNHGNGDGNNGNGNGNNGNGNGNRNSASAAQARQSQSATNTPQKLNAYKAAYVQVLVANAEAQRYLAQYQQIAAMSEAEFKAAYPNGDYQGTLSHLSAQFHTFEVQGAQAAQDAAQRLNDVTNGQPLSAAGLAELHQMLGL